MYVYHYSMCLTIDLEMCMPVWLTLAGSLATPTSSMVLSATELPPSYLRVYPPTLTLVTNMCIPYCYRHIYSSRYVCTCGRSTLVIITWGVAIINLLCRGFLVVVLRGLS